MIVPKIDLSTLPGLDSAAGLFGSVGEEDETYVDSIVDIMVFIYDTAAPAVLV